MGDPLAGPVQIIEIETTETESGATTHSFRLNEEELSAILLRPDIADKKVAVLSVAGAFRKGKSFILNFLLRYAKATPEMLDAESWMGSESSRLEGFSWRGGSERETNGILMWREPFIVPVGGEEIAVVLMDTQGAFDSQSTVKDCATVFAISTMLSSVQIYNLSQNIQEDDLQHLQLFTEYGRIALEDEVEKPFQSLLFLVRDWSFPYEAEYGFLGGQRILDRRLQLSSSLDEVSEKQHPELQQLRRHIRDCFERTACFLMPHPGLKVATNPDFKGQLSEIEDEFKQQLRVLMPRLLSPDNIIPKKINGQFVSCRDLLQYFKAYMVIFQGEELPEPKSMLLATAEANNLTAVAKAKELYCQAMEEICGGDTAYMAPEDLRLEHERLADDAVQYFRDCKKMGGEEYSQSFLDKLRIQIEEAFDNFTKVNTGKNLFRSAKTPATLFILLIIDYIFQEIFQFVGLDMFATTCSTLLGLVIFTLLLWAYTRYSGTLREIGASIDESADWIWTNGLNPLTEFAVAEGSKKIVQLGRHVSTDQSAAGSSSNSSVRSRGNRASRREE